MAHVFVLDSRARRAKIQTLPATHMSDVLQQGCAKLGLKADQFVLKHNNKLVDLSLPFRLSGLPGGAQLNLVQGSRSPAVILVALQLPESEGSKRLMAKFPSTSSLWSILRVLETQEKLNFTERGVPNVQSGAGRLFYEMPQLVVLNRELVSFVDLQKTLTQIGVNSGNVLMRLGYKITDQPLEEAMSEISQYFKDSADPSANSAPPAASPSAVAETPQAAKTPDTTSQSSTVLASNPSPGPSGPGPAQPEAPAQTPGPNPTATTTPPSQPSAPGLTVYLPTPSPTPLAAAHPHNEADYVPTLEHAASHQARLQAEARNRRLPSERELADRATERRLSRRAVASVRVRVRLPDGALIERDFKRGRLAGPSGEDSPAGGGGGGATAADVYALVRACLRRPDAPFELRYYPDADASSAAALLTLPDSRALALIDDDEHTSTAGAAGAADEKSLGWRGNVLVSLAWRAGADADAVKGALLKEEVRQGARELRVEMPADAKDGDKMEVDGEGKEKGLLGMFKKGAGAGKSGTDKEARLKSFLFGKKK